MSHDPFSDQSTPTTGASTTPSKKRRKWLWVLATLMGVGFVCLLICCGVGAYLLQNYGNVIFEPQRQQMNRMAELRETVGDIESLSLNVSDTVEEGRRNKDFMILDGVSEKGDFQVSLKMNNMGLIEKVFLVMPDGSRKPIDINQEISSLTVVPATQTDLPPAAVSSQSGSGQQPLDSTEREIRELESELELN